MTWITWISVWFAASGAFTLGYCVGAFIGYGKGAESARRIDEDEKPWSLWERY